MTTPRKPNNVPAEAFIDDDVWAIGEKNADGKKIGRWVYWRLDDGTKEGDEEWGDATTRLTYRRFHPNGELAQSGAKNLRTDAWVETMAWTRLDTPSPEDRYWPSHLPEAARRYERTLDERGRLVQDAVFDASGARLTPTGAPFPARPAGVADDAVLIDGDTRWLSSRTSLDGAAAYGDYVVWDRNGTVVERRHYGDDGKLKREEKYDDGKLWSSKDHADDEMTQSFYRDAANGTRVVRQSTTYRNGSKDRRTSFFGKDGARRFSVRMEEVAEGHVRRYDDDVLVFEAEWAAKSAKPPRVRYFDGDEVLVDYRSHGDGSGTFTLHDRDGTTETLAIADEKDRNKYGNWSLFIRGFGQYEEDREHTDVEDIRRAFKDALDERRFEETVAKLKIPPQWKVIAEVNWKKSHSADRHAKLDRLLVMMLGDDARLAERAAGSLWGAIEEQDCLFDATYDVAKTLARLLPTLAAAPARVLAVAMKELADIVCLPAFPHELPKRHAEAMKEVRKHTRAFASFAATHDDDAGRSVLHLLALLGEAFPLAARMIDAKASPATRAFAACALAACKAANEKEFKARRAAAIAAYRKAYAGERDVGVRVVLGVLASLLGSGTGSGDTGIDALLVEFLLKPAREKELYEAWMPAARFLSDDVRTTLFRAVPEATRRAHVELLVDGLVRRNALEQAEDLDVIFQTLFPDGADTELSPLHGKALRIAADVVDKHTGFVNQGEIFRKHGLPWDSFALRELADRVKPSRVDEAPKAKRTQDAPKVQAKKAKKARKAPKRAPKRAPKAKRAKKAPMVKTRQKAVAAKKAPTKKRAKKGGPQKRR